MTTEQQDKLGQDLAVNDIVIIPHSKTELAFGKIIKLTPKGARVEVQTPYKEEKYEVIKGIVKYYPVDFVKRASAIVKLSIDDAVMLKLKGII